MAAPATDEEMASLRRRASLEIILMDEDGRKHGKCSHLQNECALST